MAYNRVFDIEDESKKLEQEAFFKKVLTEPIFYIEIMKQDLSEKALNEIFKDAIDKENKKLANTIIDKQPYEEYYMDYYCNIAKSYIYEKEQTRKNIDFVNKILDESAFNDNITSYSSQLKNLSNKTPILERFIVAYKLKKEKNKTTGSLTKDYFDSCLKDGNYELLVIKLCVKLESILKADYHYEGDFFVMMDKYSSTLQHDDGWGYMVDDSIVGLLNKLRKERNNIVHPMDASESNTISVNEFNELIDYICSIDKD